MSLRPLPFASGIVTPADLLGTIRGGANPGVQASELRQGVREGLLEHVRNGGYAMIDSGALSLATSKRPRPVCFDSVLRTYRHYVTAAKNPGLIYLVAPDKIGDPSETLVLLERYRPQLADLAAYGARILVPVQPGDSSLTGTWKRMQEILAGVPAIPALPMRLGITSIEQVVEFAQAPGLSSLHLLGTSQRKHLDAVRMFAPSLELSHDANRVRAHVGKGTKITRHYSARLSEDMADAWIASPPGTDDVTEFIHEVMTAPRILYPSEQRATVAFFASCGLDPAAVRRAIRSQQLDVLPDGLTDLFCQHVIPDFWRKRTASVLGPRARADAVAAFFQSQRPAA